MGATETFSVGPTVFGKGALSIGGTTTVGDTINLSTQFPSLPGGVKTVTYTVQTGDNLNTIAAGVSTLVNANSNLQAIGVTSASGASANFINSENFTASPPVAVGASLATASATDGGGTTKTNTYRTVTNGIPATQSLTFDLNGNMTSDGTNTYQWDAENRLIQINYPGSGNTTVLVYDGFNKLVDILENTGGVNTSTKQFVWADEEKWESRNATGALLNQYACLGQNIFSGASSTGYLYQINHRNDVIGVTTASGNQVGAFSYDFFGNQTALYSSFYPDFGFTGLYAHQRSGLDLATYRNYKPGLGRWLNRDPIGERGGINLYTYVKNSPVKFTDPQGLQLLEYGLAPHYTWNPPVHDPLIMPDPNLPWPLNPSNSVIPGDPFPFSVAGKTHRWFCKYTWFGQLTGTSVSGPYQKYLNQPQVPYHYWNQNFPAIPYNHVPWPDYQNPFHSGNVFGPPPSWVVPFQKS